MPTQLASRLSNVSISRNRYKAKSALLLATNWGLLSITQEKTAVFLAIYESIGLEALTLCNSSPIFASASGRALAPAHIHRIVKRAALRAELPQAEKVSPHWLRHAHATHALENHAPIALVQATLGHVSLETTSKYLHIRPSQSSGDFL